MRVTVTLAFLNGKTVLTPPFTDDDVLTSLSLDVDGRPVVVVPFAIHEDSKRLHTICRRNSPEIDEVDS